MRRALVSVITVSLLALPPLSVEAGGQTIHEGHRPVDLSRTPRAAQALKVSWTPRGHDPILPVATVDGKGNVYVAGTTKGGLHTTPHAFQRRYGGGFSDAYIEKLSPQGKLLYATYLGGNERELPDGIAVDGGGNVYVTGVTGSSNFPTIHAMQPKFGGGINGDGFVTKLNPTGSNVIYSTYIGGKGWDEGVGIALDGRGDAYVAVQTNSRNMPVVRALQPHLPAHGCDPRYGPPCTAFVAQLDPDGAPVYGTYLSSKRTGTPLTIAVDPGGSVYVLTRTRDSAGFDANGGVLTKLDAAGDKVMFRKVLPVFLAAGLAVDHRGGVYITGSVGSDNPKVPPKPFPTTPHAFQPTSAGLFDAFVMKLDGGAHLIYATYLGGSPWGKRRGVE